MFNNQHISRSYSVHLDAANSYPMNFVPQIHPKKHHSVYISPLKLRKNSSNSLWNQLNKSDSDGHIIPLNLEGKRKIKVSLLFSLSNNSTFTDLPIIEIKPLSIAYRTTTDYNNFIGKTPMIKKDPTKKKSSTILLGLQRKKNVGEVHL